MSLHDRYVLDLVPYLADLHPPLGTFAVLGNHDLWLDDGVIVAALQRAGVTVLVNQCRALPPPFQDVVVFGLDEPGTGNPDASRLPANAGGVRIVLMHSPLGVAHLRGHSWDVAFCGHTHGGQIALPGGTPIVLPRGSGLRKHSHGLFDLTEQGDEGGGQLLVSRGVGMSDLPIRLFALSEVHLCTLRCS